VPASLGLSVASGNVGTSLSVTGSGFAAGERVAIHWDSTATAARTTVTAASTGRISAVFPVPAATGGAHRVYGRGLTSGRSASATFTVVPNLARSPTGGTVGASIAVTAQGFGANETVRLTWDSEVGPPLGTATTGATGSGSATVQIPAGAKGWHNYTGLGTTSILRAWGAISVSPSLAVSPAGGAAGTPVTATAKGLPANQGVTLAWNKSSTNAGTVVCSGTSTASGGFGCSFAIPAANAGSFPLVATAADATTVSATVAVTAAPPTSTPTRTSTPNPPTATATATATPPTATAYRIAGSGRSANSGSSTPVYDRNEASYWISTLAATPPTTAYVYVDLGAARPISSVQWLFAVAGIADSYRIQVSNDRATWVDLTAQPYGNAATGVWLELKTQTTARYVRWNFTNPNGDAQIGGLAEVRVWP